MRYSYLKDLSTSGNFFLGWLLRFAANCREPYDRGGRIWSLAIRTNRAFCNKFAAFASKLQQTACSAISLQQTAANRIFYNKFIANRTFCNKYTANHIFCNKFAVK